MSEKEFIEKCYKNGKEKTFEEYGWIPHDNHYIKKEWMQNKEDFIIKAVPESVVIHSILKLKNKPKITLIKINIYKDGGTSVWINKIDKTDFKNTPLFYLDNRIGSTTKGELFDKYPDDENALMLDKTNFIFEL
jgi:hypothetical protein